MKKLFIIALLLFGLSLPAWADNSSYYGLWQVSGTGNSRNVTESFSFLWAIGDKPYSQDSLVQWQSVYGVTEPLLEYNVQGNYFYTRLARQGDNLAQYSRFVDTGWASGHAGWIVDAAAYFKSAGQHLNLDVYINDPPITTMHKSLHVGLDFNPEFSFANFSGDYYDFATGGRYWEWGVQGTFQKVGNYQNGTFVMN